jgi:formylglycine-generating enzyme required for sulfatase activity
LSARLRSLEEIERESVALERKTAAGQLMRLVEPGTFTMGSSRSEQGRRANEVIVPVKLTKPFLIGVKEVTNREFAQFRENHDSGADIHPSMAGDNNPVASTIRAPIFIRRWQATTTRWPASPGQTPRSTATGSALAKA